MKFARFLQDEASEREREKQQKRRLKKRKDERKEEEKKERSLDVAVSSCGHPSSTPNPLCHVLEVEE